MCDVKTYPELTRGGIVEITRFFIKDGKIVTRKVTRRYQRDEKQSAGAFEQERKSDPVP